MYNINLSTKFLTVVETDLICYSCGPDRYISPGPVRHIYDLSAIQEINVVMKSWGG